MSKPENPPAFPRSGNAHTKSVEGMTLRDYFAGQAITGLLYHAGIGNAKASKFAADAFGIADAMLAEREKSS